MDIQQFTTVCERIFQKASATVPVGLRAGLKHDPSATKDSQRVKETLKFCIWKEPADGFWHRHYSSYHIIYDPQKELSEDCLFQVRFMSFLNRNEVSKGKFSKSVFEALNPLDKQQGFEFYCDSKLAILKKRYNGIGLTTAWETEATNDLAWLVSSTLPAFQKF